MAFRTRQLACLLVLLSTLGLGATASAESDGFRGTPIEALLFRQAVTNSVAQPATLLRDSNTKSPRVRAVSAAARATITTAWSIPAAAEYASAIQALQAIPRS